MRRFESIVMSETEPESEGTLWLKPKKESLKHNAWDFSRPEQFDIWYFSENGWSPIADYDTTFEAFTLNTTNESSNQSLIYLHSSKYNEEIQSYTQIYVIRVFDGNRNLNSKSKSFVTESGLYQINKEITSKIEANKTEIDYLKSEIDNLKARLSALETT